MDRSRNLRISTSMPISTAASKTSAPPNQRPHWAKRRAPVSVWSMSQPPLQHEDNGGRLAHRGVARADQFDRVRAYGVGAFRPSTLPTVSFHSLAHSTPQRLAQPASTAPSTS